MGGQSAYQIACRLVLICCSELFICSTALRMAAWFFWTSSVWTGSPLRPGVWVKEQQVEDSHRGRSTRRLQQVKNTSKNMLWKNYYYNNNKSQWTACISIAKDHYHRDHHTVKVTNSTLSLSCLCPRPRPQPAAVQSLFLVPAHTIVFLTATPFFPTSSHRWVSSHHKFISLKCRASIPLKCSQWDSDSQQSHYNITRSPI